MGGRIECPSCSDYLTPDEVTIGKSLGCAGCGGADEEDRSDTGTPESAADRTAQRARAPRLSALFSALVPVPA